MSAPIPQKPITADMVRLIRRILLETLLEYGVIQSDDDKAAGIEKLSKQLGQVEALRENRIALEGEFNKRLVRAEELRKTLRSDIAYAAFRVADLQKRWQSHAPVVRDLGAFSPGGEHNSADLQKIAVLREFIQTADSDTRQRMEAEITRLEIKAVQDRR